MFVTYYGYFSIFYSSFFMNLYYNWNIDMFCSKMFLKDNMLNTGTLMNYNCISFYSFDSEDNTSNFLKDQGRKCRFCSEENQTFNKEAHAIPEALGNKTLFSYYECDTCNDKFSVFENDLKNFLEIPIRHCMINNKKNYQNYLKPSEENNFGGQIFNDKDFSLLVGNDLLNFKEEEIKNELVISFDVETQKFIPLNVYRALIKIFLTLVDEKTFKKLEFLKKVFEDSYKPVNKLIIKEKLIGDKIFTNSIVLLLEKKVSSPLYSNPQYLMILRLKNYIYEIPIDLGMIENRTINFNSLIIDDLTFYIPEFYNFKSKIHYKLSDQTDYDLNIRNLVSSIKIEKDINYSGFNPPPNSKLIDLSDNKFIIRKSRIYYGSSLFYKLKDIREETLKKFIKNPQFINLPKDIRIRTFKNLKDVIKKIRNKELKNKLLILIKDFENSFF